MTEAYRQIMSALEPDDVQTWAIRITERWQASVEAIIGTGRLLIHAKESLSHGLFGKMCEIDLPFGARTAQRLMAVAADKRLSNPTHVSLLPSSWATLYELTQLSDEEFNAALEEKLIRPDVERKEIVGHFRPAVAIGELRSAAATMIASLPKDEQVKLIRESAEPGAIKAAAKENNADTAERQRNMRRDLAQSLSDTTLEMTGTRQYPCIYFDPPWKYKTGPSSRAAENHYPTMTWPEIIAWATSMRPSLLPDAWGFMWIPRAHLLALHPVEYKVQIADGSIHDVDVPTPLSWAVARAMGFDAYSTCCVWTKTDEQHPDDIGAGILVRDQDEFLLMFKKGRGLPRPASNEIFGSNHRERSRPLGHSRKPQFHREMIVAMTGGVPVLECFARHDEAFPLPARWDSIGNQAQAAPSKEVAE